MDSVYLFTENISFGYWNTCEPVSLEQDSREQYKLPIVYTSMRSMVIYWFRNGQYFIKLPTMLSTPPQVLWNNIQKNIHWHNKLLLITYSILLGIKHNSKITQKPISHKIIIITLPDWKKSYILWPCLDVEYYHIYRSLCFFLIPTQFLENFLATKKSLPRLIWNP